jgi:hypothetical protein
MSEYPQQMLVGNNIVNGNPYGATPVTIVKHEDGRYYDDRGYSWKYAKPVDDNHEEEQRALFEYTRNINHDC